MEDLYNFKYVDDDRNEYIVSELFKYNNENYLMMCNLNDNEDYFIGKLNGNDIEEIEDPILIHKILNSTN